jgi:RNA polymerase-binding transcription factor DksA
MRAETLVRIDAAHRRLDVGQYGFCAEFAKAIAERRLRALPFVVRCQACEFLNLFRKSYAGMCGLEQCR